MAFGPRGTYLQYILANWYKHINLEWCTRVFIQASTFVPPLHPCCIYKGFRGCVPFTVKNRNAKTTLWCHIIFNARFDVITQYLRGEKKGRGVYLPTYLYMAESTVDYVLRNDPSRAHFTKEHHVEPGKASCHYT